MATAASRPGAAPRELASTAELDDVVAFDADNDGRLDLATAGPETLTVLAPADDRRLRPGAARGRAGRTAPGWRPPTSTATATSTCWSAATAGLHRLDNHGGNANHWLSVRLRGLDKGNSKNNVLGFGSVVEVRRAAAYQFREADGDVVHFGLGALPRADLMRVVWTNGVPQNRLAPESDQWIVEEQLLKGSCPFLYAWDGERFSFVTDLLWGAPVGLPFAPGVWAPSDPHELVLVEGVGAGRRRLPACGSPRSCGRRRSSTSPGCGWWTIRRTWRWPAASRSSPAR